MEHYKKGREYDKNGNKYGPKGKADDRKKRYNEESKEAYVAPVYLIPINF